MTEAEFQQLLAAIKANGSALGALVGLERHGAHCDSFMGGPSAANPRTQGTIANPQLLPWLTIENRCAVPLGLTPGSLQSNETAPLVPAFSVPPLHRATLPVNPTLGIIWSLRHPAFATQPAWSAAARSVPYIFHGDGVPGLDPLYPIVTQQVSVQPGAIAANGSVIVQPPASGRPSNTDAVIVAVMLAIDAAGVGTLADLVSLEPCYDYAADGVTAAAPWASMFPLAGTGQQIGAAATIQLAGATGVQVTNHNAGGGQTVTPIVTLFLGTPA